MKKMIAGALIGIVIIIQGIYVWYVYMTTFLTEGNHILFGLAIFQVGVGIYILFRSSKSNEPKIQTDEYGFTIKPASPKDSLLARNNELSKNWQKTTEFRDKLKMIQGVAEEQEKKPMT
jgi:hypothetical protein